MSRSRIAFAAAAIGASLAMDAAAADRKAPATRTVTYAEADLRTAAGARALAFRIRQAAMQVCGGDSLLVRTGTGFYRCTRDTTDHAIAGLNAPLVRQALQRAPEAMAQR
jgi:UrcA family protein